MCTTAPFATNALKTLCICKGKKLCSEAIAKRVHWGCVGPSVHWSFHTASAHSNTSPGLLFQGCFSWFLVGQHRITAAALSPCRASVAEEVNCPRLRPGNGAFPARLHQTYWCLNRRSPKTSTWRSTLHAVFRHRTGTWGWAWLCWPWLGLGLG